MAYSTIPVLQWIGAPSAPGKRQKLTSAKAVSLIDTMEIEDAAWFSAIGAFGSDGVSDEMLDELLGDVAHTNTASSLPNFQQPSPRGSTSNSSVSAETIDIKVRPRRRRNYSPKEELERLRRSAADLESLLVLWRQRRLERRAPGMLKAGKANDREYSPREAMWMGVATRQYKLMRESQIENEQLRAQVLNQMRVVQGLTRLVKRAQSGLPSQSIPRALTDTATKIFSTKRKELLQATIKMCDSVDHVFEKEPFLSSTDEFSYSTSCSYRGGVIPAGSLLSSGCIRRYVPHPMADIYRRVWAFESQRVDDPLHVQNMEEIEDVRIVQGTVRIAGTAEAKCILVYRLRVGNEHRRSIAIASAIRPATPNGTRWDCVGMDAYQWIDMREDARLSDGEPHTEVRVNIETSKLLDAASTMAQSDSELLQKFVAASVVFVMNHIQNKIDSVLLDARSRVS